jgi:hypothetical protein
MPCPSYSTEAALLNCMSKHVLLLWLWLNGCTSLTKLLFFFSRNFLQTDAAVTLVFWWARRRTRVWVTGRPFFPFNLLTLIQLDKQTGHVFVNLLLWTECLWEQRHHKDETF